MTLAERADTDDAIRQILTNSSIGNVAAAEAIAKAGAQTSEAAVRRWRRKHSVAQEPEQAATDAEPQHHQPGKADIIGENEVVFHGVVIDQNLQGESDWTKIFAIFQLDPTNFEIVEDTVKITTWQQSKRLENGDRDTVHLWAHSARFRRISETRIPVQVIKEWRETLIDDYAEPQPALHPQGAQGTYNTLISDPQLGKKGTEEAVENWKRGVKGHCAEVSRLILTGQTPERLHVAFMGDESEGVCNNYPNQPHTIELNKTGQLELDFDMRVWTLREFASFGLPLSASSVISNHGEWTRNGSKDVVTTRGDNASTYVARQVKRLFDEMAAFGGPRVDWTIGGGDPGIIVNLSGVRTYFSHGYIEKGRGTAVETRTRDAMQRQIIGRTEELGDVQLYYLAHYHHLYMQEWEGRTQWGCPALEAEKSSEYMRDQYGVWSPPGALGMLVGSHLKRGWTNANVF